MIEVRNITKVFPGAVAVRDVSFAVASGEIVGFLGPNGAGKSTLMRILTGYIPPTTGSATVAGFDVLRHSLEVRRRVGYLPENNPLYPEMRVEEYLEFRATLWGVPRKQRAAAVGEAVQKCGLGPVRHRIVGHISKGYRQRLGLADAIVHDPQIIILDEPTIGLDPNQVRQVRDLIRELGRQRTVILSTHILSEVEKMCGRVLIIHGGRLVADGSPSEIVNRLTATGRVRLEIRGTANGVQEQLKQVPGIAHVTERCEGDVHTYLIEAGHGRDVRPELFRRAARSSWEVLELSLERVTLEDAFAELTEGERGAKPAPAGQPSEVRT
ncbi:MAG: ATP-binding cassette domain-containing protein [Planctomycetes bacterium]|nr:ATP-binding cassette domain-containing protein [Planctomycetota bacterium]